MARAAQRKNKKTSSRTLDPAKWFIRRWWPLWRRGADLAKWAISAFVIWQVLATTLWLLPSSTLQQGMVSVLRPYMWMTACWQNWQMFAPNPASEDVYMEANIAYQDGTTRTWVFPRMIKQGFLQRYEDERFRKMIENAHLDSNSAVWPFVARFAGIANNRNPRTNPVVRVQLIRCWQDFAITIAPSTAYKSSMFYSASYPPGSLPGAEGAR